jgi:hypothetical protein
LLQLLRHDRNCLLAVFAITLFVRGGVLFFHPEPFAGDPDAYRELAESLSHWGIYGIATTNAPPEPTAFRPPLYPYLLSWLTPSLSGQLSVSAVAFLHALLGAMTATLVAWITSRLIDCNRVGKASLLAGTLVAIDPVLLNQSTQLMTETLASLLATGVIAWWVGKIAIPHERRGTIRFVVLGGILALAYLCRPTFLVWAVLLAGASFFLQAKVGFATRLTRVALAALLVAVALFGWTLRNKQAIGHPIWATSHGGYTLLLANNASFYEYLRSGEWGRPWDANSFLNAYVHRYEGDATKEGFWTRDWSSLKVDSKAYPDDLSEHQDDRYCYEAARATIDRQPSMFVWSCFVRVARLWSPLPHVPPGRGWTKVALVGLYYCGMYLAIAMTIWRYRRRLLESQWWSIWALAFTLTGVHAIYWTNIRMRAPIIPALAVLAAGVIGPLPKPTTETDEPEAGDVAHD